jgi:hypothetical protein
MLINTPQFSCIMSVFGCGIVAACRIIIIILVEVKVKLLYKDLHLFHAKKVQYI